jgi:hypothetical protein
MTDEQEQQLRDAAVAWQRARTAVRTAWQRDEANAIIAGTVVREQTGDGKFVRSWPQVECTTAMMLEIARLQDACTKLLFEIFPVPPDAVVP